MPPEPRKLGRRYHLHPPGLLFIAVTTILGVGAINSQNNLLFVVFGVALGALVFSGLISGAMLMGVSVERRTPTPGAVGQPLRLTYTVRNANRLIPAFALSISEHRPARATPPAQRWTRLITGPRAFVAEVGPRASITIHAEVRPLRRGATRLDAIVISTGFPFGVFRKSVRFAQPDQIVIAPGVRPLAPDVLRTIRARARSSEHAATRRGRGNEFYGLRDYVRGDSPRTIAWKASARSGELVTRLTAEHAASELRLLLLLDPHTTRPPRAGADPDDDPNERAITLAASIIDAALRRAMHVGLAIPQAGLALGPAHSPRHRQSLFTALALIDTASISNTVSTENAAPFAMAGANLLVAPAGARHPLAPDDVPALDVEALARWALDEARPRTPPRAPATSATVDRGAA